MSFANADAALKSLERYREKLNDIALAAHDAGKDTDEFLKRIRESLQAAMQAEKHFKLMKEFPLVIDSIMEEGLKAEEILKRIIKLQQTDFQKNQQRLLTDKDREILASGGIPPGFGTGMGGGSLTAPPGTILSAEEQMMLLRGGVGPGMSRGPATALEGYEGRAWGEMMSPQDTLRRRGILGQTQVNLQEANAFADALEATVKRFEAGFPNSYFTAVVLAMEIPYLRIGARSAAEARLYIQSFEPVFGPGFRQALAEPGLSQLERSLTNEAMRILQTGNVSAGGGGGAAGTPRQIRGPAPAEQPSQVTTSARISGVTAGAGGGAEGGLAASERGATATRGDIAALGTTITRTIEQNTTATRTVTAAVTAQTNAVQSATQEANRRLAEQFRSIQGWQQRVETGYFRPMNEGITEVRRNAQLGARQTMDLAAALERLQLSGALSPGSSV